MAQDVASARKSAPQVLGFDTVMPLASRPLFWRPRFLRDSPRLNYLPFLFWLCDALRPNSFVTLGAGDGTLHFALCQAAEKLTLEARGYGLGPWGAAAAASEDILAHNEDYYPDLSQLLPAAMPASFPFGSIDLLLIDLTQEISGDWLEDWLDRLSTRGVILVHGANHALARADAAMSKLLADHPAFRFDFADGLVLAQVGLQLDERVASLCRIGLGDIGYAGVVQVFARFGSAVRSDFQARQADQSLARLNQTLAALKAELAQYADHISQQDYAAELERVEAKAQKLRAARDEQAMLLAVRTADLTESTELLAQHKAELLTLGEKSAVLVKQLEVLGKERDQLQAKLAEQSAASSSPEVLSDGGLSEVAHPAEAGPDQKVLQVQMLLTRELELLQNKLTATVNERAQLSYDIGRETQARQSAEQELAAIKAQLKKQLAVSETLRKSNKALEQHSAALDETVTQILGSTSWKLTAPMRKLLQSMRRS